MAEKNKLLYVSFLAFMLVFSLSSISALTVTPSTIDETLILDTQKQVQLLIQNTDSFTMFNITPQPNPYLSFTKIDQLASGSSANVTATIFGDDTFKGTIRLQGFFQSNRGKNFENHNVSINYPSGSSICDQTITEGDRVSFLNNVNDPVKLINANTGQEITTIPEGGDFAINFSLPQTLTYYTTRLGQPFPSTETCTISAVSSIGPINDPEKDAIVNFNLNVVFPNTTLQINNLLTSFNISVFSSKDSVFNIGNVGSETAKSISISSPWVTSFSPNNFDLVPGTTENIGFTIIPTGLTSTNDTNKTHQIPITIKGNFPTFTQNISVFVPFFDLDTLDGTNIDSLEDLITSDFNRVKSYCGEPVNRNKKVCRDLRAGLFSGSQAQAVITDEVQLIRNLLEAFNILKDEIEERENARKLNESKRDADISYLKSITNTTHLDIQDVKEDATSSTNTLTFIVVVGGGIILIGLLVYFIVSGKRRKDYLSREAFR